MKESEEESYSFAALASPLHPFHLWRWIQITRIIKDHRKELSNINDAQISEFTDPVVSSPYLLISGYIVEDIKDALKFIGIGNLGALPLYIEPQSRTVSRMRSDGIAKVVHKFINNAPHANYGFEVVFIDPQSLTDVLEAVLAINRKGERDSLTPIHVRVLRTRRAPTSTEKEDERMEELTEALNNCQGSLRVEPGILSVNEISEYLSRWPAHYTVFIEPGDAAEFAASIEITPRRSPILLPRHYKYDRMNEQFEVLLAGDASEFGPYYSLFQEFLHLPKDRVLGRRAGAQQWKKEISNIAQNTMWYSIVDQGVEPTFNIEGSHRLGRSIMGDREFLTFTAHKDTLDRFFIRLIEQAQLIPDQKTCDRTYRLIRRLGGDTLSLTAETASFTGKLAPTKAIGLMGVLGVVLWHEKESPRSLLVSLDTDLAQAWILGHGGEDGQHGDLLSITSTNDGVILEIIEVKVRDLDKDAVHIDGSEKDGYRITGNAVDQIDNTIRILKQILGQNPNPLDITRREILKDQLYQAAATQEMTSDQRWRVVQLLEEFFQNGPSSIRGHVFVVRINSGDKWEAKMIGQGKGISKDKNLVLAHSIRLAEESISEYGPDNGKVKESYPTLAKKTSVMLKKDEVPAENPAKDTETKPTPISAEGISIIIGKDPSGNTLTWDTTANPAFGIMVTGDTGFGKTQTLKVIIAELRAKGYPVLIFDYKPDYHGEEFVKLHNLRVYDVKKKGLPFNPLGLIPDDDGNVHPITQAHEFAGILKRVFPGSGDQQKAKIVECQKEAYEACGWDPKKRVSPDPDKRVPTFADVMDRLKERKDKVSQSVHSRLSEAYRS